MVVLYLLDCKLSCAKKLVNSFNFHVVLIWKCQFSTLVQIYVALIASFLDGGCVINCAKPVIYLL